MIELLRSSYRWNAWANRQVIDGLCAMQAPPEKAIAAYQHVLEAEATWFGRLLALPSPNQRLWAPPDLERCRTWTGEIAAMARAFVESLDEEALGGRFEYANSTGRRFSDPVGFVLQHVLLHSSQYRGEAVGFAHHAGLEVIDLDFIFWERVGRPE